MPEELEVDTEKLHEAIHDELEREGGNFLKRIALTTAVLAALAAIASLEAGSTVNEALLLKTEATRDQAEASDQWAYFQAKGLKAEVQEAARAAWLAQNKAAPSQLEQTAQRYAREQEEIEKQAREKERARDEKSAEADRLLARHRGFAYAVTLFQIAITLGAVAALTRAQSVWMGSVVFGAVALVLFILPWFR
jgi:hypothetical protein